MDTNHSAQVMPAQVPNPKPHEFWLCITPRPRLVELTKQERHDLPQELPGPVWVTAVNDKIVLFRKDGKQEGPATDWLATGEFKANYRPVKPDSSAASSSG